jgi:hypothetical protein
MMAASAALTTVWISANLGSRFEHRDETIAQQLALLDGRVPVLDGKPFDWLPFQSRILFPALLRLATEIGGLDAGEWYLVLRIGTAFTAFLLFGLLCQRVGNASPKLASAAIGCLAFAMLATFNHAYEHPTDYLDVACFTLLAWACDRRRPLALLAVAVLGAFNHQTAAFGGVLWLGLHGLDGRLRPRWRPVVWSGVVMLASYATSSTIRTVLRGAPTASYEINGYLTLQQFMAFLRHPQPFAWPMLLVAMLTPSLLWLTLNRGSRTAEDSRWLWTIGAIVAASSLLAFWAELRSVFLGPLVLLTYVATRLEARTAGQAQC